MRHIASYHCSFMGWKIYRTNDFCFYARKGNHWITRQSTLTEVKQIVLALKKQIETIKEGRNAL